MRLLRILLVLYAFPVDKAVKVVAKEGDETNHHGEIGKGLQGCKQPKPYQHDIVCRISQRIIAAA